MNAPSLLALLLLTALPAACGAPDSRAVDSAAVIGRTAPEVSLAWLDGEGVGSLADLRGRVVLLEFWRTWCGPCLAQVPHLNDLHDRYEEDGLTIVGVTNQDEALVRSKVVETGMAYPVALVTGEEADRAYGITAVPRAFLIDRQGALVWVGHPGTLEEGRLRELLYER
jgi:thiol-disulfide isomerase/thioredoxin